MICRCYDLKNTKDIGFILQKGGKTLENVEKRGGGGQSIMGMERNYGGGGASKRKFTGRCDEYSENWHILMPAT